MAGILITYRETDANGWVFLLHEKLVEIFGNDQVVLKKNISHVGNGREKMQRSLEYCKVVLVVIGPHWLTITDEQNLPRIQLPDDAHHQDIAFVLSRSDVTIIPVLVDNATMPSAGLLPPDLQGLSVKQSRKISDNYEHCKADIAALSKDIMSLGGLQSRVESTDQESSDKDKKKSSIGWLGLHKTILAVAFALTLAVGMYAYFVGELLDSAELFFLLIVFYALLLVVRWSWIRIQNIRK